MTKQNKNDWQTEIKTTQLFQLFIKIHMTVEWIFDKASILFLSNAFIQVSIQEDTQDYTERYSFLNID